MPGQQMTGAEARGIDQINTTVAISKKDLDHAGIELFPEVDVLTHGGKIMDFGDEVTEEIDTLHADGADVSRVTVKYSNRSYALETHALDGTVSKKVHNDSQAAPGIDIATRAIDKALKPIKKNIEIARAGIARNPDNYIPTHKLALPTAARWDKAVDPSEDIAVGINAIEVDSGGSNIVAIIPSDVMAVLRRNDALKGYMGNSERSILTPEILASIWSVNKVVVAKSLQIKNGQRQRIWGKDVILAHVPNEGFWDEPSFGYTFRLKGTPEVSMPYWDSGRRSWVYPVDASYNAQLIMPEAGYLLQNVVD